jgi:hypothetical protein
MKRTLVAVLICFFAMSLTLAHEMVRDKATIQLGKGKVTIDYGTPKLKGRNLDEMIQAATPWRLGMDDPTTLETSVALDVNGKKLAPGKYTLYARPVEKQAWTLLISSSAGSRFDPKTVVAEAPLHFMKDKTSSEMLKITLAKARDGASLLIAWGTYRLHGSLKAAA